MSYEGHSNWFNTNAITIFFFNKLAKTCFKFCQNIGDGISIGCHIMSLYIWTAVIASINRLRTNSERFSCISLCKTFDPRDRVNFYPRAMIWTYCFTRPMLHTKYLWFAVSEKKIFKVFVPLYTKMNLYVQHMTPRVGAIFDLRAMIWANCVEIY